MVHWIPTFVGKEIISVTILAKLVPYSIREPESRGDVNSYHVYILASKRNGTLYAGFTSNLVSRVHEHKSDFVEGFTKKYGIHTLVYYETCDSYDGALQREKQIKEWKGSGR